MRLHHVHVRRRQPRRTQRIAQHALLRRTVHQTQRDADLTPAETSALARLDRLAPSLTLRRLDFPGAGRGERLISADDAGVAVLVIPTDEELEIARDVLALLDL